MCGQSPGDYFDQEDALCMIITKLKYQRANDDTTGKYVMGDLIFVTTS